MQDDDGGVYPEQPARIKHGHLFRPERITLRDPPNTQWAIEEVLDEEDGSPGSPVRLAYRFRVAGPLPGRPGTPGLFVMIAVSYHERSYWWVWPEGAEGLDTEPSAG